MVGSSNSVPETAIISVLRGQPSQQSDESRQRVLRRCVRRPIGVCLERKGFWLLVDVSIVWFINQLFTWKIIIIQHLVNLGADGDAGHAIDCCRCMASLSLQLKVPQSAGALKPSSTEWTWRMEKEVASTACLGSRFREIRNWIWVRCQDSIS